MSTVEKRGSGKKCLVLESVQILAPPETMPPWKNCVPIKALVSSSI